MSGGLVYSLACAGDTRLNPVQGRLRGKCGAPSFPGWIDSSIGKEESRDRFTIRGGYKQSRDQKDGDPVTELITRRKSITAGGADNYRTVAIPEESTPALKTSNGRNWCWW